MPVIDHVDDVGLVLWDIDGTLVDVHGTGRKAFAKSIELVWNVRDDLASVKFAGATDLMVLEELRARLVLDPARDERFFDVMSFVLEQMLAHEPATALPGAVDVVAALRARDVVQGLVTGNAERCARHKLRSAGIDVAAFAGGAYGDEHADRVELAARARDRCAATTKKTGVVLVGDTPADVKAAKHIGAVAVGVVGKAYTRAQLEEASADVVVERLVDLLELVR